MHAFLIIGNSTEYKVQRIDELSQKLDAKIWEYPLVSIDDVRNLNNLIRLTLSEKTLIVIKDIHEAGIEALNAFLKNLEEPQPNVYFALTAPSVRKVLPTIVSRCQIIKVQSTKYKVQSPEIEKFLDMTTNEKLFFVEKIKDRAEAITFVENLIFLLHREKKFDKIDIVTKTRTRLKANGNVNLQLSNLAINI